MIGQSSAIRKYQKKLPTELSKRYGGSGPYTQAQVEKTIDDLGLNRRYIRYAYLMYCERENMDREIFTDDVVEKMNGAIAAAVSGGIVAAPMDALLGTTDSDGFVNGGDGGM